MLQGLFELDICIMQHVGGACSLTLRNYQTLYGPFSSACSNRSTVWEYPKEAATWSRVLPLRRSTWLQKRFPVNLIKSC